MKALRRRWPGALFVAVAGAAVALSFWCAVEDRLPGDLWLTRRVQDLPGWFETVSELVRALTTTWVVVIAGTVLVTVFDFTARRKSWLLLAGMMVLVPPVQALIKNLVDRPRPDPSLVERRAGFTSESYPSGHVLSGTVFFLLCAWLIAGRMGPGRGRVLVWAVAAALIALNSVANVYEGVHWPSDVLGGLLWAGVFAGAAWLGLRRSRQRVQ